MGYVLMKCEVGRKNDRIELEKLVRDQKWIVRDLDIKVVLRYGPIIMEMDPQSFEQLKRQLHAD